MTTADFYSFAVGVALAVLTVVGCLTILMGWFFWLETRLRRSQAAGGPSARERPTAGREAWGEPDLAAPSTSAAARAEVDHLEELWALPTRRH